MTFFTSLLIRMLLCTSSLELHCLIFSHNSWKKFCPRQRSCPRTSGSVARKRTTAAAKGAERLLGGRGAEPPRKAGGCGGAQPPRLPRPQIRAKIKVKPQGSAAWAQPLKLHILEHEGDWPDPGPELQPRPTRAWGSILTMLDLGLENLFP